MVEMQLWSLGVSGIQANKCMNALELCPLFNDTNVFTSPLLEIIDIVFSLLAKAKKYL